jgi:hypothetical protein
LLLRRRYRTGRAVVVVTRRLIALPQQLPGLCLLLTRTRVGHVFLHSRDYRHVGIEEDEEHDETAHEGPEYNM